MHPSGTTAEEVAKVIREEKLGYPTLLAPEKNAEAASQQIGGYAAIRFPYCILVDAKGCVVAHGTLFELLDKFDQDVFFGPGKTPQQR